MRVNLFSTFLHQYSPETSTVLVAIGNEELKQILDIPGTVEEHNLEVSLLFSDVIEKLLAFSVRSSETEETMSVKLELSRIYIP